jgi:hypothetical protein
MLHCSLSLRDATRLRPKSFVGRDGRAVAWLEIEDHAVVGLFGTAAELRELAAVALLAAEQADALLPAPEQDTRRAGEKAAA